MIHCIFSAAQLLSAVLLILLVLLQRDNHRGASAVGRPGQFLLAKSRAASLSIKIKRMTIASAVAFLVLTLALTLLRG